MRPLWPGITTLSLAIACSATSNPGADDNAGGAPSVAPSASAETCGNGLDDTADGMVDEGCACTEGSTQACFSGSASRRGMGACRDGVQTCQLYGEFWAWGACAGEVLPSIEIPDNGVDEDCSGDACTPTSTTEDCSNQIDDDCDGQLDCADAECAVACGCQPAEQCDNGADDDCDGHADCADPECASTPSCDPTYQCTPEAPYQSELACDDGKDNDCDGKIDCNDSDCRSPGQCGCTPVEMQCKDGTDDDCDGNADCNDIDCQKCTPGANRYCDEPQFCAWGTQTCQPNGSWGPCTEVPPPPGCEGPFGFFATYDAACCIAQGHCCQNYPQNDSVGTCVGVMQCS